MPLSKKQMEDVIDQGGSVLIDGKIVTNKSELSGNEGKKGGSDDEKKHTQHGKQQGQQGSSR